MQIKRKIRISPDYEYLRSLIESVPDGNIPTTHTYCNRRNTVQSLVLGDVPVVVKRFKRPGLINSLVYTHLRPCKADRSFDNARKFLDLGIITPEPIAVIIDHRRGRMTDSWYISRLIEADPIGATVTETDRPAMDRMFDSLPMLQQFVDFTVSLFSKKVYQRDFNRGNFLVVEQSPGQWAFPLVDINRVSYEAVTPEMLAMAWVRFGADTCPGLVERLTVETGRRLGLDESQCRRQARKAVERGARIERRRQFKRAIRRRLHRQ